MNKILFILIMCDTKKKIIISCSSPGSLVNFRGKLIEELVKKQNAVYVFTPKIPNQTLKDKLIELGVIIHENNLLRNNISIFRDIRYLVELHKIIRRIKPDIFFSYTFKPIIFGSFMASICGVKEVVAMLTGLGYNFTEGAKKNTGKITQRLLKLSFKSNKSLKVVFQNEDDYNELINRKIIGKSNKTFIVNGSGVDLSHYEVSAPNVNNITFLMMSRLIKAKGIREFYEAAEVIKSKYSNVTFKLIGWYEKNNIDCIDDDLYQKIASGKVIQYDGPVNDVRPHIKNSSIVVLPSYREGTPRSILEAMSMGRAVITTDTAGCRQTVNRKKGFENGLLVPIKEVSELVSSMEFFIKNPREIIRFGENGRLYAEEKFNVNSVNKHMLEILGVN